MGRIIRNGINYSSAGSNYAENIKYNNTTSGLEASDVQSALDELAEGSQGLIELTQAEYDALPESKLTDNVSYYITDGGINGSASTIKYSNVDSGLEATTVQGAIDEIQNELGTANSNLVKIQGTIDVNDVYGEILSTNCAYYQNGVYHIDVAINITTNVPASQQLITIDRSTIGDVFNRRLDALLEGTSENYFIVCGRNTNYFIPNGRDIPAGVYKLKMTIVE